MALQTFSGLTTGTFIAAVLDADEDALVEQGAVIYDSVGFGLGAPNANHDIEILGTVYGRVSSLTAGASATVATGLTLTVGASGVLSATIEGVFISGFQSTIVNAGQITGGYGIEIFGTSDTATTTIDNSGSIISFGSASFNAGIVQVGSERLVVTNTGLIKGLTMSFNGASLGTGISEITNSGVMVGDVLLGAGDDLYDGRLGMIDGDVFGGTGDDVLGGGVGAELLDGGDNDDELEGNGGDDSLIGGAGQDTLDGGIGADDMAGGDGDDGYVADDAGDLLTELSEQGTDSVSASIAWILGDHFENLTLTGSNALDGTGNTHANHMTGNDGSNALSGLDGVDVLEGLAGKDRLIGGGGADELHGGTNADRFVFTALSDSTKAASGRDTIVDFSRVERDRIDLSALDASTKASGNQAFDLIGTKGFSGVAGQLRYVQAGGDTVVQGDIDGDRNADFAIMLHGEVDLAARDFLL